MRGVVVSAIVGKPDFRLRRPTFVNNDWDYIMFTDRRRRGQPPWQIRRIDSVDGDPRRDAKRFKMLAHEWLPDYDYHLWIDAHCVLLADPELVAANEPVTLVRHWCPGQCIRAESARILTRNKAPRDEVQRQMAQYTDHPDSWGLWFGGFVGSRNNDEAIEFKKLWHHLTEAGSVRDQLSLPVALRRSGVQFRDIPRRQRGRLFSITKNA